MPPVRWKFASVSALLFLVVMCTEAQMQEPISMTSDGWRPIVGTRKETFNQILHYRNQNGESIKAETTSGPPSTTQPPTQPRPVNRPGKIPPHSKPNGNWGMHGAHIPIGAMAHSRPSHQVKKYQTHKPPYLQVPLNGKRHAGKPVRNHGNRDDIFVGAHSTGSYAYFKSGPQNNVKTRETLGLGLPGTNHFSFSQPQAHFEFTNRFALPPPNDFQYTNPGQSFIFPKHPQTNDISYQFQTQGQNDEYTQNLVPPPFYKEKPIKEGASSEKPAVPQNVVVQLPPPFDYPTQNKPVQVQVTKEKLNVFHNNVPVNYNGDYYDYDFHSVRKPITDLAKLQSYEVTEGSKPWGDHQQFPPRPRKPPQFTPPPQKRPQVELNVPPFLPTPYRPEASVPTSPTQSEVSTIFTKLSLLQRESSSTTSNPSFFDIKEVSTHYPIVGKPSFEQEVQTQTEISNDVTTIKPEEVTQRVKPVRRRRPSYRRTTTTTTTTEEPVDSYESQKTQEESDEIYTRRRPSRYRTTTEAASEEVKVTRGRNRYRTRPTTSHDEYLEPVRKRVRPVPLEVVTEMPQNHKPTETEEYETTEVSSEETEDYQKSVPSRHYVSEEETKEATEEVPTTAEILTTHLHIPENEIEVATEQEITTTTEAATTQKPQRIRRPIKYDNSNRPRFSVKDYRQKLNQYSSTTTEAPTRGSSESSRLRYPSRSRRPTSTTSSPAVEEDETTEPTRAKFAPKEPRHSGTTETIITEKNVKAVNTRLRPFGRYRSTTAATTTTPKVAIKSNLFARRRPPPISLRMKIYNRHNKTEEKVTTEETQTEETTLNYNQNIPTEEITTTRIKSPESNSVDVETTTTDISRTDNFDYSQRVSDLTSSAKNDYNTPGLFKSVSPTSRRIPSYFTIATDDPILPIEAFFPNLKSKDE